MMSSVGISKSMVRRWSGQVPWCKFATSWPACFGDRGRCVSEECREPFVREGGVAGRNVAGQVRAMMQGNPHARGEPCPPRFDAVTMTGATGAIKPARKEQTRKHSRSKQTVLTYIPCRLRGVLGGWWDVGRRWEIRPLQVGVGVDAVEGDDDDSGDGNEGSCKLLREKICLKTSQSPSRRG